MYLYSMYNKGGGGDRVVWRQYTGVIRCVFDQILNLQNCPRGPQTDTVKHLPQGPFTGQFLRKAYIKGLVSL
jgi:hypothetical protein